jgi:hypothetical protein
MAWTYAGEHLPWLRGQGVHLAAAGHESTVAKALTAAGYVYAHASSAGVTTATRFASPAAALKLDADCGNNLDAFADSLRDLPARWPGRNRIVLLWSAVDELLHVDMLGFLQVVRVLGDASDSLWAEKQVVFETVAFLPEPFGTDSP